MSATQAIAVQGYPATVPLAKSSQHRRRDLTPRMPGINSQTRLLTAPRPQPIQYERSRGHSEMGSRDHGMVEFGVQIPMAPFDSLRSLMAGHPHKREDVSSYLTA